MAHTTHRRRLFLPILVLLLLVTSLEITQGHGAENGARDMVLIEGEQNSQVGLDPMAFLVLDMWLTGEGVVSLTWSDLGPNFVYTVEFSNSMSGRWDMVPPVEQWPTNATSWTDPFGADSSTRFYRILTEAHAVPSSDGNRVLWASAWENSYGRPIGAYVAQRVRSEERKRQK